MGRKAGSYSKLTSRQMYARILATKRANIEHKAEEDLRRRTDPVEIAKGFLQRQGYHVFSASVIGGPADRFMVGRNLCSPDEVVAMALRIEARIAK